MRSLTPCDDFCPYLLVFGLGIVSYVKLAFDPPLLLSVAGLALFLGLGCWKKNFFLYLGCFLCGFMVMTYRSQQVAAPRLEEVLSSSFSAVVYDRERAGTNFHLVLTDLNIASLPAAATPKFVAIKVLDLAEPNFLPGDLVNIRKAKLFVNEPASTLHGYDLQFFAWFKQLGATGYTNYRPYVLQKEAASGFSITINRLRSQLASLIEQTELSQDNQRLTKAILLGYRKDLNGTAVEQNLRLGGIGHILAISGLHMALCAALVFTLLRSLLALNSYLALRYHLKKIAAVLSFFAVGFYFCLSGFSVSALRAFTMISFTLVAILIDRPPVFMRILCWTAFLVLLTTPEQLFTIGFQMSFLAVITISRMSSFLTTSLAGKQVPKLIRYLLFAFSISFGASLVTSLVAFQSFSYFGGYNFLTNLVVLPLVGLLVLPLILLTGLLLPLGLANWLVYPLDQSLTFITNLSAYVAALPYSYFQLASIDPNYWGAGIGLVVISLFYTGWLNKLAILASGFVLLSGWILAPSVDLYLRNQVVGIVYQNEHLLLLPSWRCTSKFVRNQWRQQSKTSFISPTSAEVVCSKEGCEVKEQGLHLLVKKLSLQGCGEVQLLVYGVGENKGKRIAVAPYSTAFFGYRNGQLVQLNQQPRSKPWHNKKQTD